jgi:hypothetical protein
MDIDGLALLAEFYDNVPKLMQSAVNDLRSQGYSWADIGEALGIRRQTAWERFGRQVSPDTEPARNEGPV